MLPVLEIPKLRRVIEITDFNSGEPIVHKLELYKTDRIDCYDEYVDGAIWKKRIGWSQILVGIRKAMLRRVINKCILFPMAKDMGSRLTSPFC
jgi:hypothetical protein